MKKGGKRDHPFPPFPSLRRAQGKLFPTFPLGNRGTPPPDHNAVEKEQDHRADD
jgi:hypothetical protein